MIRAEKRKEEKRREEKRTEEKRREEKGKEENPPLSSTKALREGGEDGVVEGLALYGERRLPPPECLWGECGLICINANF